MINVTDETYQHYFPNLNSNFQQNQLRLGEPFDYILNEELWLTVFRLMNAFFMVVPNNYTNFTQMVEDGIHSRLR